MENIGKIEEKLTTKCIMSILTADHLENLLHSIIESSYIWVALCIPSPNSLPVLLGINLTKDKSIQRCLDSICWKTLDNGEKVYGMTDGEIYDFITYQDILNQLELTMVFEDMFSRKWIVVSYK